MTMPAGTASNGLEKPKMFIVTTIPLTLIFFKGQVSQLKRCFDVSVVSSPGERLDSIALDEDVTAHSVAMKREISLLNDLVSLLRLVRLFARENPEVVHGNTPKGGLLSMIAARLCRVPNRVYYVHGLRYEGATGIKRHLLMTMERIACRTATEVYAVSYGVRRTLLADRIHSGEITVIWNGSVNGIDVERFSPIATDETKTRRELGIFEEATVVGFVGRLAGDKGVNELVEAFQNIQASDTHHRLLLVGPFEEDLDPLQPDTLKAIQNNPAIIHAGFQDDVRPFLNVMDVFVLPSYREGFGVSIMEAQAMGVPVVCSDISGCNEIIDDGYNGLLIRPKSVADLQRALERLLTDSLGRARMKKVARQTMQEKYDQERLWDATVESYSTMIKRQARRQLHNN